MKELTVEQLEENWNKLIQIIKDTFEEESERRLGQPSTGAPGRVDLEPLEEENYKSAARQLQPGASFGT